MQAALQKPKKNIVYTVNGPIDPPSLGLTLPHEHILVDFAGADKPSRPNLDDVFDTMLPRLISLKQRGVAALIDCTPAYLGRDAALLQRLSRASGLHILTPTGYYGAANDKFVPAHAYTDTVDELAARWITEFENGIDSTGIRPGFIKIGVDLLVESSSGSNFGLSVIDAKIVRAAARTHKRTGLVIASHTPSGSAALAQIALLREEGVGASSLIIVHADSEADTEFYSRIAAAGAWLEFDGITSRPPAYYAARIRLLEPYHDRILLSMDSGWYDPAKPNGGDIRDYNYLTDVFLHEIRKEGIPDRTITQLTVNNPANAFAVK